MAIAVRCGACRRAYNLNDRLAGQIVQCKECGGAIQVPAPNRSFGAPAPAHPADSTYPGLAEIGRPDYPDYAAPDPLGRTLSAPRRKTNYGPFILLGLVAGTLVGGAMVGVWAATLAFRGGVNLPAAFSSAAAPKRARNAVRPITAQAEAPAAPVVPAAPVAVIPAPAQPGKTPEQVLQELLDAAQRVAATMAAIRDEATARQHEGEVAEGLRKLFASAQQVEAELSTTSAAESNRLKAIYEPQLNAAKAQVKSESERISRIPHAAQILARSLRFEELRQGFGRPLWAARPRRATMHNFARGRVASLVAPGPAGDPFAQFAEREVVEIVIQKLPRDFGQFISDRIRSVVGNLTSTSVVSGDEMRMTIAPIKDLRALAAKIDFGKVTIIDEGQSLIVVEVDAAMLAALLQRKSP